MHAAMTGQCPKYICDTVYPLSALPERNRLQGAAGGQFDISKTRTVFREAFSVAGQRDWNTLPHIYNKLKIF